MKTTSRCSPRALRYAGLLALAVNATGCSTLAEALAGPRYAAPASPPPQPAWAAREDAAAREKHGLAKARDAHEAYTSGRFDRARELYAEALALSENRDWRRMLGLSLMHLGRCPEAMAEFNRTTEADYGTARCLGEAERWTDALTAIDRAIAADPRHEEARALRTDLVLGGEGKLSGKEVGGRAEARHVTMRAEEKLKTAWGLSAGARERDRGRALCSVGERRVSDAERPGIEAALREALGHDPNSPLATFYLACLRYEASDLESDPTDALLDEGIAILAAFRKRNPSYAPIDELGDRMAGVKNRRDANRKAAAAFEKAVAQKARTAPAQLPTAAELLTSPRLRGILARVTVRPNRVTEIHFGSTGCQFELHDPEGAEGTLALESGRYLVKGKRGCPWLDDGGPVVPFDMLVRFTGTADAVTRAQLRATLPILEVVALRYGSVVVTE